MYWHWQNLNEDRRGDVKGSGFWHGRAWFNLTKHLCGRCEWVHGVWKCALELAIGGEDGVMLHVAIPPVQWFASVSYRRFWKWLPAESMTTGIRIFDSAIWLDCWRDSWGGWTNYQKKWQRVLYNRQLCLHLDDLLLGRMDYQRLTLETKTATVYMPEAAYPVQITFERSIRKRPRWIATQTLGCQIDIPGGIPVPGKGENSWDCGDDAILSMGSSATTVSEAVADVVKSVMRTRERYASIHWRPEKATA